MADRSRRFLGGFSSRRHSSDNCETFCQLLLFRNGCIYVSVPRRPGVRRMVT